MSSYQTIENILLSKVEAILVASTFVFKEKGHDARLQILEGVASKIGGFSLSEYFSVFKIKPLFDKRKIDFYASNVLSEILKIEIHPSLVLSALARETLTAVGRKNSGAYHTDFRLAAKLAQQTTPNLTYKSKVIDPACGSGILLTALTIEICGSDKKKLNYWLKNGVHAADLSKNSLRGCLLSLASFSSDLDILQQMWVKWYCGDSLLADDQVWTSMCKQGYDAVIGNPPWEKIKLSKHEFLTAKGESRHYGSDSTHFDKINYQASRNKISNYGAELGLRYPNLMQGEADLYIAFTELFYRLCKPGGIIIAILPGGLIRSQGTEIIRRKLLNDNSHISISIFDNKARYFEIDSRFKFLLFSFRKLKNGEKRSSEITLTHARATLLTIVESNAVNLNKKQLFEIRKDYSIPEVRTDIEWEIFQKISANGESWDEHWVPSFCREVDMTKEKPHFKLYNSDSLLPLIEGRMINQYRFGSKTYVSGSGRKAVWRAQPIGDVRIQPQFWISPDKVTKCGVHRTNYSRVGFCDITGQTNERSLMAALIPPNVVCGNKVPTIIFDSDEKGEKLLVWTSIANSFAFDWMLRRIITTTVNYFLLQSVPLPRIVPNGLPWKNLVKCCKVLNALQSEGNNVVVAKKIAILRAEIDAEVAVSYGLSLEDISMIFNDFPIVDKNQIPLVEEKKSTVTRDMIMAAMAERLGDCPKFWQLRVKYANQLGAIGYVPSEISVSAQNLQDHKLQKVHGKCI